MSHIEDLLAIMARLRDPREGCPWDRAQDFTTIAPHTLEEAYEVADAIARKDMADLKDELGDLLFQVVFHARMAEEAGHFRFEDVVQAIVDKLTRRHPHVFGDAKIGSAAEQSDAWEESKAAERAAKAQGRPPGALDHVPVTLPAMSRAVKIQRRVSRVGFDWNDPLKVLEKIAEESDEVREELGERNPDRLRHEIGDLLFACVNLARHVDVDPETALRETNLRFERRFRRVESLLAEKQLHPQRVSLEEMETLWRQAKREEKA